MPRKQIEKLVPGDIILQEDGSECTVINAYHNPLLEAAGGQGKAWMVEVQTDTGPGLTCCNSQDEVEIP